MEAGPSSSSGFSTRATAALQEPPVNLIHSMVLVDEERAQREAYSTWTRRRHSERLTARGCCCELPGIQSVYGIFVLPISSLSVPRSRKRNCGATPVFAM
jgi:hypothetical protein